MNKIYILCEYGISLNIVQKLKKFSINEILYKPYETIGSEKGISDNKGEQILQILSSKEFEERTGSIYELIEHGISINQINILHGLGITLRELSDLNIDSLRISTCLKNKLKKLDLEKIYLEDNEKKRIDFSDVLEKEIRIILEPFEVISIINLRLKLLERKKYPIQFYISDLNKLKFDKKIEFDSKGIFYKIPSLLEIVESIADEKKKEMLKEKLTGETLESVGKKYGITRERVRQILTKVVKELGTVKEDKYRNIFEKYDWDLENFTKCFNVNRAIYEYLNMKYDTGCENVQNLLQTDELDIIQREALEEYYDVISVFGEKIVRNKQEIQRIFLQNLITELTDIEVAYELYNEFIKNMIKDDSYLIENVRNFEGIFSRTDKCISSRKRTIRYYDLNKNAEIALEYLSEMFENCEPGEYSTLFFFEKYPDFMHELDIRDEYELHNLIKFIQSKFRIEYINCSKMPHIFLKIDDDKKAFFEEVLRSISPISVSEAAQYFYENYGQKPESASAYISTSFSEFIHEYEIRFEVKELSPEQIEKIKLRIREKICTIRNAKEIFKMFLGDNYIEYFNPYNLNLMGYKLKSEYIQSKDIVSTEQYFKQLINSKKIIYINELPLRNPTVYNILASMENNFDIIKIGDGKYMNYSVLEGAGVSKEMLYEYGDRIKKFYLTGDFFTLKSVRNELGEHVLDAEGFDNYFYESLIFRTEKIKKISLDGNAIFYISSKKERHEMLAKDFIYEIILEKESISLYELIDYLEEEYGILIKNEILLINIFKELKLFYSDNLQKVYIDKMIYFNDVYGEE